MECRRLEITIISAVDLENVRHIGKMKVYARVSVGGVDPGTEQRTPIDRHAGIHPAWNSTMRFNICESLVEHHGAMLVIKLYCKRKLGDRYVGEVHKPMKELFDYGCDSGGSATLVCPVQRGSVTSQGFLRFSYRFGERISVEKLLLAESIAVWKTS